MGVLDIMCVVSIHCPLSIVHCMYQNGSILLPSPGSEVSKASYQQLFNKYVIQVGTWEHEKSMVWYEMIISWDLISFHLIWFHVIWFHFIWSDFMSCHLILSDLISFLFISSHLISSHLISFIWSDLIWFHLILFHHLICSSAHLLTIGVFDEQCRYPIKSLFDTCTPGRSGVASMLDSLQTGEIWRWHKQTQLMSGWKRAHLRGFFPSYWRHLYVGSLGDRGGWETVACHQACWCPGFKLNQLRSLRAWIATSVVHYIRV